MSLNMETWAFEPPPGPRGRRPIVGIFARNREQGHTPLQLFSSGPPAVPRTQTATKAQLPNIIPSEPSSKDTSPVRSLLQIQRTSAQQSPGPAGSGSNNIYCQTRPLSSPTRSTYTSNRFKRTSAERLPNASVKGAFPQTEGSREEHSSVRRTLLRAQRPSVENSPRVSSSAPTLPQLHESPVEESPSETGPIDPCAELEGLQFKFDCTFSFNLTRVIKILSTLRQRVQLLPISVILANVCLKVLYSLPICA